MGKSFEERAKELVGTPFEVVRFTLWSEGFGSYREIERRLEALARKWGAEEGSDG